MRKRLGDTLVSWGILSAADLDEALAAQSGDPRPTRRRLGRVLLDQGRISEWALASALADMHGLPCVDLGVEDIDDEVAHRVPQSVELQYLVLPLWQRDGILRVAVADPIDVVAVDDLRVRLPGVRFEFVVAPETQLRERIADAWREARSRKMMQRLATERQEVRVAVPVSPAREEAGSVAAVEDILTTAVRLGASDIHVEPGRDTLVVRMRIDGQMREVMTLPKVAQATILARLKVVSGLDIVERRLPQDGRARLSVEGRERNLRVSSLPTMHGETMVVRLLADHEDLPVLSDLGMPAEQASLLRDSLRMQQGLVLVTGPTGSGKSTTLYSAISEALTPERKLISLEDPVEIELPGVSQVAISERTGLTFAAALRATLRQDPDVIMVGEIRDSETADLATRASLTGHLVISTLHTLDAPAAVARLVDMGTPAYLVAPALVLCMAQRLVRRPCRSCLSPDQVGPDVIDRLHLTPAQAARLVAGRGCIDCAHTGYRGRVAIYELMPINPPVRAAIGRGEVGDLRSVAAANGWTSLLTAGIAAAVAGNTTAAELLRVLTTSLADVDALASAVGTAP